MAGDGGHRVTLRSPDRPETTVEVDETEAILPAAERAGLVLPHGCREGRCSSCTARLIEGDIDYAGEPHALDEDRRAAGYVLVCVGRPRAACTLEIGTHVREAAFPALWGDDS